MISIMRLLINWNYIKLVQESGLDSFLSLSTIHQLYEECNTRVPVTLIFCLCKRIITGQDGEDGGAPAAECGYLEYFHPSHTNRTGELIHKQTNNMNMRRKPYPNNSIRPTTIQPPDHQWLNDGGDRKHIKGHKRIHIELNCESLLNTNGARHSSCHISSLASPLLLLLLL